MEAAVIAAVGMPFIEALGGTYHWRTRGAETLLRLAREGRQPILAFWHGRILAATLYLRDRDLVVLTSQNFDGEWITRIILKFGYRAVRGSTSRGGARALQQMRRAMKAGSAVVFTVDGPRGPACVAQPGAIWLSSATGNPVVPFHIEASSYWTVRSWDRQQVPKPGAELAIAFGDPIEVPAKADEAMIEAGRLELERALGVLRDQTLALLAPPGHDTPGGSSTGHGSR